MERSILNQLQNIPRLPGVYIFKNKDNAVIYIGKAVNLANRINNYFFRPEMHTLKIQQLISYIHEIDYIIANSEQQALILECDLIKKYRPRFNVRLRDDKTFPYIKIDTKAVWPRIYVTRRIINDGAKYFGPFVNSLDVKKTLDLIKRVFKYKSCKRTLGSNRLRPCLNYHIGRCPAPCAGFISEIEYRQNIVQIIRFLEGKQDSIIRDLKHKMTYLSNNQEYEQASIVRDQLKALQNIVDGQKIGLTIRGDKDAIAIAIQNDFAVAEVFRVRNNRLISKQDFTIDGVALEDKKKVLSDFIKIYYGKSSNIPPEILLEYRFDDMDLVTQWLKTTGGKYVKLLFPTKGEKKDLLRMVVKNAENSLGLKRANQYSAINYQMIAKDLSDLLCLRRIPDRIEGYDISNIHGKYGVGSMVVFEQGKPDKNKYRKFLIKGVKTVDDYSMISEVLRRRFNKYLTNSPPCEDVPDLVLIDGGKGHLNTAIATLKSININHIPIIALAKENEEIFTANDKFPVRVPRSSRTLHLLQWIRDEAHRFAIRYHKQIRGHGMLKSELDEISGIGPKRKRALIQKFSSVNNIKDASYADIALIPGITKNLAIRIKQYLSSNSAN